MMDELELLKKDWQKKEEHLPKLSYKEIYTMIWKKSSSIVKWIFYISIIELLFWIVLNAAPFFIDSYQENLGGVENGVTQTFIVVTNTFSFVIIAVFIYFLYKAYRGISVVDNVKSLMESILRTRKIVQYYVGFNLIMAVLITLYTIYDMFTHDEKVMKLFQTIKDEGSELKFWLLGAVIVVLGMVLVVGFIWLFYRLIYGFLLRKLNQNYKELKKLEV
ncbi:MAG: hypothetical protein ABJN95_05995 [Maribacter sp.]|uniref:hypothetical protein n=1 Tax=Maribacter sp. TaxID=1897614 RepID=UPI0032970E2E